MSTPNANENTSNQERPSKKKKVAKDGAGDGCHYDLNRDTDERGDEGLSNVAGELLAWDGRSIDATIFAAENPDVFLEGSLYSPAPSNNTLSPIYRSSIYVDAFNLALDTVLQQESHLFSNGELDVFASWHGLDYEAQYLFVMLQCDVPI